MSEVVQESARRPKAHTIKEAADILRCTPAQVRYMLHKGELGSVRRGREIIIPETCIQEYLTPPELDPELIFYTSHEVADMLKLRNVDTVYKMIRERRIGHVQRGRNYLVSKAALLEYVRKAEVPAVDGDE